MGSIAQPHHDPPLGLWFRGQNRLVGEAENLFRTGQMALMAAAFPRI